MDDFFVVLPQCIFTNTFCRLVSKSSHFLASKVDFDSGSVPPRWIGERKIERQGELFVYSWVIFTVVLYVVNFLSKDYFLYSPNGQHLSILSDLSLLSIEVLAVFILTRSSKILKNILIK